MKQVNVESNVIDFLAAHNKSLMEPVNELFEARKREQERKRKMAKIALGVVAGVGVVVGVAAAIANARG